MTSMVLAFYSTWSTVYFICIIIISHEKLETKVIIKINKSQMNEIWSNKSLLIVRQNSIEIQMIVL